MFILPNVLSPIILPRVFQNTHAASLVTMCTGVTFLIRRACRWHPGPWVYSAILPARLITFPISRGTATHIEHHIRVLLGVETASSLPLQCWSRAIKPSTQLMHYSLVLTVDPIIGLFVPSRGGTLGTFRDWGRVPPTHRGTVSSRSRVTRGAITSIPSYVSYRLISDR